MTVRIREATPDDAEQLLDHVRALVAEGNLDIPLLPGEFGFSLDEEREILTHYQERENWLFLVAEDDSRIVADCNLKGSSRAYLRHCVSLGMAVSQDWRGKGIGHQLMERAIAWARETPCVRRIELNVYCRNSRAIHLYEKFGFIIEGKRQRAIMEKGQFLDDYLMALLIDPIS